MNPSKRLSMALHSRNSAMDWGMIDFQEEEEDFDKRMIEKYGHRKMMRKN